MTATANHDFEKLRLYERINVIGTSGSGKSTFGRRLAARTDLPYFEMDQLFWKPNWGQSTDTELLAKIREVTQRPRWILDGNYTRTTPEKWQRVQLVIWLDLSFVRTVSRVTRRALSRSFSKQELWPGTGNRESLAGTFLSKESIIWWAMTTHRKNRRRYAAMMAAQEYDHIHFVRLTSKAAVAAFLTGMHAGEVPGSVGS
ncbi:MAG: shikimate kinase [Planctomycetota bacterium]